VYLLKMESSELYCGESMPKGPKRRKPGERAPQSFDETHWAGHLLQTFDLESALEDLEGDLRAVLEDLTGEHAPDLELADRDLDELLTPTAGVAPHAKPAFDKIKAVIPARDFELSKRFYGEVFDTHWETERLCEFRVGTSEFLLQDVPGPDLKSSCVHQVTSVDAQSTWLFLSKIVAKYAGTSVLPPKVESWGTVVYLCGPSGESWCVTERRRRVEGGA
jgi:hypothetical protein